MPQSLTLFIYHLVFSTKDRKPLIKPDLKPALHAYMAGILRELGGTPILINGVADHVHVLTHVAPKLSVSDVVRDLKANSSRWVHATYPERSSFAWQRGYAGFTVSRSNVDDVRAYIADQEAHHMKVSFQDEYRASLRKHGIEFDERYVWD